MGIGALVGAGISAAGSLFGASKASSAANKAANAQVQAANIAANTQKQMFGTVQNIENPFIDLGNDASQQLRGRLRDLTTPIPIPGAMTQSDLEATPGYQFTLGQGLKATQNSAAMRGLGVSGAAIKGAASYATGLSDQTYNERFNQAQTNWQDQVNNQQNAFNKLYQTTGIGTTAAGSLAGVSVDAAKGIAASQTAVGSAQAAGINTAGQATAAGITGTANGFNNALSQYLAGNSSGMYGNGSSNGNSLVNLFGHNFLNGGMQ